MFDQFRKIERGLYGSSVYLPFLIPQMKVRMGLNVRKLKIHFTRFLGFAKETSKKLGFDAEILNNQKLKTKNQNL